MQSFAFWPRDPQNFFGGPHVGYGWMDFGRAQKKKFATDGWMMDFGRAQKKKFATSSGFMHHLTNSIATAASRRRCRRHRGCRCCCLRRRRCRRRCWCRRCNRNDVLRHAHAPVVDVVGAQRLQHRCSAFVRPVAHGHLHALRRNQPEVQKAKSGASEGRWGWRVGPASCVARQTVMMVHA